jgi:hypothetical protein
VFLVIPDLFVEFFNPLPAPASRMGTRAIQMGAPGIRLVLRGIQIIGPVNRMPSAYIRLTMHGIREVFD